MGEHSRIKEHFAGKTIFLTGVTGFLGHIFLEKLLRINVKCVYVLIRPKKYKSTHDRIQEIYNNCLFDKLRQNDPDFIDKIIPVNGQLDKLNLNIDHSLLEEMTKTVEIILHGASDVRFDLPLVDMINFNLCGTHNFLQLACKLEKLENFVYISTAFSHCPRRLIEEQFYPSPISPNMLLNLENHCSRSLNKNERNDMEILTSRIMLPWPNSYVYSKAATEDLVKSFSTKLPIIVVRPSIILPINDDPLKGWCNSILSINGLIAGGMTGTIHVQFAEPSYNSDCICGDHVTNSIFAIVYSVYEKRSKLGISKNHQPEIYNILSTGNPNIIKNLVLTEVPVGLANKYITTETIWYPFVKLTSSIYMFRLLGFFLHVLPALFIDNILSQFVKLNRQLLPIYRKFQYFSDIASFGSVIRYEFKNPKMLAIYDQLNSADLKEFPCDVRHINWKYCIANVYEGIRVYILKAEASPKRKKILFIMHYTIKYLFFGLICFFIYKRYF